MLPPSPYTKRKWATLLTVGGLLTLVLLVAGDMGTDWAVYITRPAAMAIGLTTGLVAFGESVEEGAKYGLLGGIGTLVAQILTLL